MLNKDFKSILWEYDIKKLGINDEIVFIRSLTIGDKNHIDYLKNNLGIDKFKEKFLKNISSLDKKTINYWGTIFGIDVKKYLINTKSTYEKLNEPIFTRSFR